MSSRIILASFSINGTKFEVREDFVGAEGVLLEYWNTDQSKWMVLADWPTEEQSMSAKDWYEKVIVYFQGAIERHFKLTGQPIDQEPDGDWFDKVRWHFKTRTTVENDNIAFRN